MAALHSCIEEAVALVFKDAEMGIDALRVIHRANPRGPGDRRVLVFEEGSKRMNDYEVPDAIDRLSNAIMANAAVNALMWGQTEEVSSEKVAEWVLTTKRHIADPRFARGLREKRLGGVA